MGSVMEMGVLWNFPLFHHVKCWCSEATRGGPPYGLSDPPVVGDPLTKPRFGMTLAGVLLKAWKSLTEELTAGLE